MQLTITILQPNLLGRILIDKHSHDTYTPIEILKYYNIAFILNYYLVMSQSTIKVSYIGNVLDMYCDLCLFLTSPEWVSTYIGYIIM